MLRVTDREKDAVVMAGMPLIACLQEEGQANMYCYEVNQGVRTQLLDLLEILTILPPPSLLNTLPLFE